MKNITKDKNEKELKEMLAEKQKALVNYSDDLFQGKTKNVKEGRSIRKQIAQVKTAMRMNKSIKVIK